MYIKEAWRKFRRALLNWMLLLVATLVMAYLGVRHNLAGSLTGNLASIIVIVLIGAMTAVTVATLALSVCVKYKKAVDLETQNSDKLLETYADTRMRTIDIEPMMRRRREENEVRYEKREDGWVMTIQNLEVSFRTSVIDGHIYGMQVVRVPSGDQFISILKQDATGNYYATYWDGVLIGSMHERTLEALWYLADEPSEYWHLRKGH